MPRKTRERIPTRVDLNVSRVLNMECEEDVVYAVFPNRNARHARAAFVLIFLGLKYDPDGSLTDAEMEELRRKHAPQVSQKTLWKARATMSRLGFIYLKDRTYWRFSEKFANSCRRMADLAARRMIPRPDAHQRQSDWRQLDNALAYIEEKEDKENEVTR